MTEVWVFTGVESNGFPGGIFFNREEAELWIEKYKLTGTLTRYPVGVSVYDWAVDAGRFKPSKAKHFSSDFIGSFTTASQEHYHYECGKG